MKQYNKNMSIKFYQPTEELKIVDGVYKTSIDGLCYIEYPKFIDNRGLFSEIFETSYRQRIY